MKKLWAILLVILLMGGIAWWKNYMGEKGRLAASSDARLSELPPTAGEPMLRVPYSPTMMTQTVENSPGSRNTQIQAENVTLGIVRRTIS